MATIMAEALMVVIIIVMSTIIFVWVVPVFTGGTIKDNSQSAYLESFKTTQGSFIYSNQLGTEATRTSPGPWPSSVSCPPNITTPVTENVLVPANASCTITAKITGNVFVQHGGTLIVNNTSITGGLVGNYSAFVNLINVNVAGDVSFYHIDVVTVTGSTITGNFYAGDRGSATMIGTTVSGMAEFEVNTASTIIGNRVGGQLEAEADGTATVTGNTAAGFDDDGNGAAVVSGNTFNGDVSYGQDGWCASGNNVVTGSTTGACTGQVTLNIVNTGSIPVTLRSLYIDRQPSTVVSWTLAPGSPLQCGNTVQTTSCPQLPIIIPVGQGAQLTLTWTPPSSGKETIGLDIYLVLVSSHSNYVDAHLYMGADLTMTSQSRTLARECPPCIF